MIAAVDWASPAEKAKLQPGDVILSYDGKPIERSRQLPRLVADTPPDKQGQADDLARRQGARDRAQGDGAQTRTGQRRRRPTRKSPNRRPPSRRSASSSPN